MQNDDQDFYSQGKISWESQKANMLGTQFDLEAILKDLCTWRGKFFEKHAQTVSAGAADERWEGPYLEVSVICHSIAPTLLAPVYYYNRFIKAAVTDIGWDYDSVDLDEDIQRPSGMLRRISTQIEAQSILVSIKSGLDRLVSIFRWYYRGLSEHTTFGRIAETGKASGLMELVVRRKESDPLLEYIHSQYIAWIREAVSPRDSIIHYKDLDPSFRFDSEAGVLHPTFYSMKEKQSHQGEQVQWTGDSQMLCKYVYAFYEFTNRCLSELLARQIAVGRTKVT